MRLLTSRNKKDRSSIRDGQISYLFVETFKIPTTVNKSSNKIPPVEDIIELNKAEPILDILFIVSLMI